MSLEQQQQQQEQQQQQPETDFSKFSYAFYKDDLDAGKFYYNIDRVERVYMQGLIAAGQKTRIVKACSGNRNIAIKLTENALISEDVDAVRELNMLRVAQGSPRIVELIGHTRLGGVFALETELLGRNLLELLRSRPRERRGLAVETVKHFAKQIFEGVAHLHRLMIIHGDIKLENVCLVPGDATQIKICDFGVARLDDPSSTTSPPVTIAYMAPELLLRVQQGFSCDVWAASCTVAGLFVGRQLFQVTNPTHLFMVLRKWNLLPPMLVDRNLFPGLDGVAAGLLMVTNQPEASLRDHMAQARRRMFDFSPSDDALLRVMLQWFLTADLRPSADDVLLTGFE